MNFSKRNPLLRNNMDEFNKVIGSLGEEIQEQNLNDIGGGSTQFCLSVAAVTAVTKVTSMVVTGANDWLTKKLGCGGLITATAECFGC